MFTHTEKQKDWSHNLQSGMCHILLLSSKDLSCQEGSDFHQPQWVQEPLLHISAPGNPSERWLGDSSPVAVFLKNSFRNFQDRWNMLTGFFVAITPILRNPFNLPRSQADTHNLCEATEQWRAGKELKKPLSSFIQKHFHLSITFQRSTFTSRRRYNIAD